MGLIPEARLLRVKKKQKGKVLPKFALHLARSSHDLDDHVKWRFPISGRIQKK